MNVKPAPVGPAPVSVTMDLEDHRPSPTWEVRYPAHAREFLDFCEARGLTATIFVVGRVAERSPELVREIAERGHEIGVHNYEHWPLFSSTPAWLREHVGRTKAFVEDLIGAPVHGFRAPAGTLIPRSFWATEVLAELGFTYSASVLPFQTYGVGFPGCPRVPFRWPSGLIEAPCPGVGIGPVGMPFMGGTFLRVFPRRLSRRWADRVEQGAAPWTYLHPYDLDVMEPFWVVHDVALWGSVLLWINRGQMLSKLDAVLAGRAAAPLGERLATLDAAGAIDAFDPSELLAADGPKQGADSIADRGRRFLQKSHKVEAWSVPPHLRDPPSSAPAEAFVA